MDFIIRILVSSRMLKINLLLILIWLFTGSSVIGKAIGSIMVLYTICSFLFNQQLFQRMDEGKLKQIFSNFGGVIFGTLALLFLLNIHTQDTAIEGLVISLLVGLPMVISGFGDRILKPPITLKNRVIFLTITAVIIWLGLDMVINPEPASLDLTEIILVGGLIYSIFKGESN